jgi:hypothetical protein
VAEGEPRLRRVLDQLGEQRPALVAVHPDHVARVAGNVEALAARAGVDVDQRMHGLRLAVLDLSSVTG